jgi:hypothetical protein
LVAVPARQLPSAWQQPAQLAAHAVVTQPPSAQALVAASQVAQAPPRRPQVSRPSWALGWSVGSHGMHEPSAWQQPSQVAAQVSATQAPPAHARLLAHAWHSAPFLPQAIALVSPARQRPSVAQQPAQVCGEHAGWHRAAAQVASVAQTSHCAPPAPQPARSVPAMH